MSSAKRFLIIGFSFAIVLAAVAAFTPRAVHAITATLVNVVNTSANPVPVSDAATQFEADVCFQLGTTATASGLCNGISTFVVPNTTVAGATVKRLVVKNFSGFCSNYSNPNLRIKAARLNGPFVPDNVNNGLPSATSYAPMIGEPFIYVNDPGAAAPYTGKAESDYTFGETTHWVFNPGDTVRMDAFYFSTGVPGETIDLDCIGRVAGYLITQ